MEVPEDSVRYRARLYEPQGAALLRPQSPMRMVQGRELRLLSNQARRAFHPCLSMNHAS